MALGRFDCAYHYLPGARRLTVKYPTGVTTYAVDLTDQVDKTGEDVAATIQAALNAVVPGAPFTCTYAGGAFGLWSGAAHFDLWSMDTPLGAWLGWAPATDVASVISTTDPPGYFYPLRSTGPETRVREVHRLVASTSLGRRRALYLGQRCGFRTTLRLDAAELAAWNIWLAHASRGVVVTWWRDRTDSTAWSWGWPTGRTVCVLDPETADSDAPLQRPVALHSERRIVVWEAT